MLRFPFPQRQKLTGRGSSRVITIAAEWFENNNIDKKKVKEVIVIVNENLVVLNPKSELSRELDKCLTKKNMTIEQLEKIIKKKEVVF